MHQSRSFLRVLIALAFTWPLLVAGQTLTINNKALTYSTLTSTTVTMTGTSELFITGTSSPISGSVINLNSTDSWFFMTNILPSTVVSTYLSQVRVNGVAAVADSNCRVVQYGPGAVIIPQGPSFAPMTVYDSKCFAGNSASLQCYTNYNSSPLPSGVRSFKLKRGYTATIAQANVGVDGSAHPSKNYVAADGDLEVSVLPSTLDQQVQFIRIFPWRWTSKKGIAGDPGISLLNVRSWYNWNIDQASSRDLEYVPIRAQRYWPSLGQDWNYRGANHLLGYNEPNSTSQSNIAYGDAIWSWPDLLATGLRVGSPAVTDGGKSSWLYPFINAADAAGLRVDFIAQHYYQGHSASDPNGAASQMYSFLLDIWNNTHRPIWITEWNNGANWTDSSYAAPTYAQQQACIAAMINMLESTPFVERYQLYNWVEDTRSVVVSGTLTAAGVTYRDKVSAIGYQQALPSAGISPAAWFAFNGDFHDSFANGNDAMAVGAPNFVTGKFGQAITLDGTSDYLQVSPGLASSTDFTFAGWVKWNGGVTWQRIFDFGAGIAPAATTGGYMLLTPNNGSVVRFAITTSGYNNEQGLNGTAALPANTWTHVAVTHSGNTGKLFVNGALVATNTSMTLSPASIGAVRNYIGKSQFSSDPMFSGQLDDLRFYSSALSDAQIASIANNAPPTFSANPLVLTSATTFQQFTGSIASNITGGSGALAFSKISGPGWLAVAPDGTLTGVPGVTDRGLNKVVVRVTDVNGAIDTTTLQISVADAGISMARYPFDGNANAAAGAPNGTTSGTPSYVAGVNGQAISLNGTDAYVTLPSGTASSDVITIAMWLYAGSTTTWQRVFDFGSGTSAYMFLTPYSSAGTLRFAITSGSGEQTLNITAPTVGQWVHVVVTLGANVGRLYVNGVLRDTETISIKPTDFPRNINYIGKSQFSSDPLFNGRVDEFLIFNQVLSASQIAALANSGNHAPIFSSNPISAPAGAVGQSYEQTIASTASDVDAGSALMFLKVSGPQWLTVSTNGRISGVPSAGDAGANYFVVRASDQTLLASDTVLNIVVGGSSDLLLEYQFNGNTTDNVSGNAAPLTGSAVYASGLFDRAISLDGSTNYLQLPVAPISSLTDFTIAARVKWNGGNDWQRVFDFGNGTTQYLFLTPKEGTVSRFVINNGGGEQVLNGPAFTIGDWTHVAVTLSGNTGTLYLNGAAVASGTITLTPAALAPALNYLGKSQFSADPLFNGVIDDFRIYGRGLSASEIAALSVPPTAVTVPDSSYAGWSAGFTFPAGQSGQAADPDEDGVSNAWEYLLGSNPLVANSGILPGAQAVSAAALGLPGNKTYLAIQARVRKQRLGVTLVAEAAATVEGLAAADAANHAHQAGASVTDGAYEILTYYYDVAIGDSPIGKGFIRLRAISQ